MISYKTTNLSSGKNDGFSDILKDAKDLFQEQHINILGEGYQEIISDDALFEDYKEAMLKGVDADEVEALDQLISNSRICTIQESFSGITPISSLSVPTIRKLWPRMSLKNAIPNEPVELPKFSLSYIRPYIIRNGQRVYLPEGLKDGGAGEAMVEGQALYADEILFDDFTPTGGAGNVDGARKGFDLLKTLPGGAIADIKFGDSIDPDFAIVGIKIQVTDTAANVTEEWIDHLRVTCGLRGDFYYKASKYAAADYDADGNLVAGATMSEDEMFGRINFTDGMLTLTSNAGLITGVKVKGRLNGEYNNHSESVSFDIDTRDVTIGSGVHLNAPLPIEFLQDTMALYNIDGAAKVVDIMTNVFALKLDNEMRDFITEAWVRQPKYQADFDCKPYAQFTGTPKEWREMLKDVIDHQTTKLKQDLMYRGGKFVIVGNELDINLIPNVSWSFVGSAGERSGVEVDYSLGAISGSQRYEVISSPSIKQGALYVFFVSSQDEQMTYKYFPYSFNIEKGYVDAQFPNVPSLMMAKRHKLEVFNDACIKINILNNTGDYNF